MFLSTLTSWIRRAAVPALSPADLLGADSPAGLSPARRHENPLLRPIVLSAPRAPSPTCLAGDLAFTLIDLR